MIWIDHHAAIFFPFNAEEPAAVVFHPADAARHIHHKTNEIGAGCAADIEIVARARKFFCMQGEATSNRL